MKRKIPRIREIRVFGSYCGDSWKRGSSDVDIFAYSDDPEINRKRDFIYIKVSRMASSRIKYGNYHYFICNDDSPEMSYIGKRGCLRQNMRKGRLLYKMSPLMESLYASIDLLESCKPDLFRIWQKP